MYFRSRALGFRCKTQSNNQQPAMAYSKDIVEKLSQFNNLSFTKKQWDIILKGCGCPKSSHFWSALKMYNLQRNQRLYTLLNIDSKSFDTIWINYCKSNRAGVRKNYFKMKAKKQIEEGKTVNITFYMIDGYLTIDKPIRE